MTTKKILIVEDDPSVLSILKTNLEHFGYQISACVGTGEEAIRSAGEHGPDAVLIDAGLEGKMDGMDVARQIQKDFGIPSIFVTGDDGDSIMDRSHQPEPLVHIVEPFSPEKLKIAIETSLFSSHATQEKVQKSLGLAGLHYRNLVENMNQGIFHIDNAGKFIWVNTYFAKMMGYESSNELLRLAPSADEHFISADYHKDLLQFLREDGHVQDFEFQACHKDGRKIWLSLNVSAHHDPDSDSRYFEGFVRDITKWKQMEEERFYLLARQTALLAAIPEIVMEVDSNKAYTWANRAGYEFFGNDVIGKQASDYFEGEQTTYNSVQPIFDGKKDFAYVESWQRRRDGKKRLLAWECQTLRDSSGNVVGALSSARDITDRKLAEQVRSKSFTRQMLLNRIQQELLSTGDLTQKLKIITDGIVSIFDADFCRIWLIGPGDLCEHGCMHASVNEGHNACRQKDICLQLISSSGRYTHTNGVVHQRIPFGAYMIGRIASGKEHLLVTNDVDNYPDISDHDWARRLGLASFAGFQLRLREGEPLGVLALFSRHTISPEEQNQLDALSNAAAQVIGSNQAEQALRESEERFRLIAETIDEAFWVYDLDEGGVTYFSPAHERIWGHSANSLYKDPQQIMEMVHPDDREKVASIAALLNAGQRFEYEYRIVRPDGSVRHIWDRSFPIPDKDGRVRRFVGVGQDVTKQRKAEEDLRKSKDYLDQIINCIGDPIFVKDRQHRIVLSNDANCAFLNLPKEEIIGRTLTDKLPKDVIDPLIKQEEQIFKTGQPSITVDEVRGFNGRQYTVMTNKTLLSDSNGSEQIVGVIRDITDLKKAENDRANMEIQLRQAQKLEAIGQLAAGIAHEINTPTQYVSDNTRFLKDAFDNFLKVLDSCHFLLQTKQKKRADAALIEQAKATIAGTDLEYLKKETPKALSQSLEGLNHIAAIVRAMKEFSHPGSEEKQSIDLNHSIENTLTVCRNEWKYVAEVITDFDAALPPVPCLPGDFNQVILNLIINAAHAISDAANSGGKEKGIISIKTRHDGNWVDIRIGDTGTGIPEKYRDKIFNPFFTTKEVGKGTGQGLAISRSVIVGKHGGTLEFESEAGKGATFIIRLPLNPI